MGAPMLVTGATGFLGRTLCPYLVQRRYELRAFVRPTANCEFLRHLGVELAWGDVRDRSAICSAAEGCWAIVHAAGKFRLWGQRKDFFATNVEGTRNTLEAARLAGVERFIFVSTVAVIGAPRPGVLIDESYPPSPRDDYQRSKLEAERLVLRYHHQHGLPSLVLRPGAFYGPGGRYGFNRLFFEDPLKGLPLQVHGGRRITFPVYIQDVAQCIDLALRRGQPGEVYNASGRSLTHSEINRAVDRLSGCQIRRINAPAWALLMLAQMWTWLSLVTRREPYYPINLAPYVFRDWVVSSEKARRDLGFVATPFEKGAAVTLKWYHDLGLGPTNWLARLIKRLTGRER